MGNIFTGFSTLGSTQKDSYKLYDLQLIEQDLMNHFQTRMGERVMRPEFGCRIWDYLQEPFSDLVQATIQEEAIRICNEDTRVSVVDIQVSSNQQSIQVNILLNYIPFQVTALFTAAFENRQNSEGF